MKSKIIIAISAIFVLAAAGAYYWSAKKIVQAPTAKKDTLIIGYKNDILGFAPKIPEIEWATTDTNLNIFNTLIETDGHYKIQPALAESWISTDKLTWRFFLRKGVKFHNGDDFTAADIKYSIDYYLNDSEGILKNYLITISKVSVIDDYTVEITTKEPNPILLNQLTSIYIIPKNYKNIPAEQWPVGTGAYQLKEYVKGDHITLERFDGYWGGAAPIKNVTLKIIPDDAARMKALASGQIEIADAITLNEFNSLQGNTKILPVNGGGDELVYLSFDFRKKDSWGFKGQDNPTADIRVRKAIYKAIDEQKIITNIMGVTAEPASQFVVAGISGYNPAIARLPYDLEDAKKLMKEAGYEDGFNIQLDCSNNLYVNDESICREVARQLADINIRVNVSATEKEELFAKENSNQTSFYMDGWGTNSADGGEIFDYLLHTFNKKTQEGTYNSGFYSNPEVDRLSELARSTIDPAKRIKLLQQAFQIAASDIAWIPLHAEKNLYGVAANVNWEPRMDQYFRLRTISFK